MLKMSANTFLFSIIKVALICLIVAIGIGLAIGFIILPKMIRTREVEVPDLASRNDKQAFQQLQEVGLRLDTEHIEKKPSANVPEGYIIEQDPLAHSRVKLNRLVRVTLSAGNETFPVPDITGKPLEEAQAILKNAGFRRGNAAEVHSDRYPNSHTVIAQTPPPGIMHQRGGTVHLLLSLGARPKELLMPDLRGMPIDEVSDELRSHGLGINKNYKPHPKIPRGSIISHEPGAGAVIQVGQIVTLELSGSPRGAIRGYLIPIRYKVRETGVPLKHVQISLIDEGRTRFVVDGWYKSGQLISHLPVKAFGKTTFVVREDGEIVKTEEFIGEEKN